jgi:hypothetical protein
MELYHPAKDINGQFILARGLNGGSSPRTHGVILSSHEEWVKALGGYKGNVSRSLQMLETRGWIIIGRSPGGNAHHLRLTVAGQQKAAEL